ncbi:virion core protein, T7 gp14 family [Brevundimonas sp. SL130]|uniref:virion core protein, T7 gp14 family n=1 Tax=Brevundimonas sp. SL130 TaxID=2995143 RepID=UPI00226D1A9B|nr:hypothetical protein [Brevundimonas sp. SL130]WAC60787.1 hypothetical protein OU998_04895 [Brevundimonas sp. SL130]
MAALAVATTAGGIVAQVRSAKKQEAAIREQLAVSQTEIDNKATAEINDRQRAARREQARIKVAAGQAGLQLGGSIDSLLQDSLMQAGLSEERTLDNRATEQRGVTAEANSMLSRVERPTIVGAALQLGSAGMNGYAQGKSLQIARQNAQTEPK